MKKIIIAHIFLSTFIMGNSAQAGWFSSKPKVVEMEPKVFVAHDTQINYTGTADRANEAAYLRITTRGDTATVVGLSVISAVLGGGASSFRKEELRGSEIKEVKDKTRLENPMPLVQASIVNYIDKKAETQQLLTQKEFIDRINIEPDTPSWSLIYDSSDKNIKEGYSLNFGVKISRNIRQQLNKGKWSTQKATAVCIYKSEPLSLTDWKANDYEQMVKYRQIAADHCSQELLAQIDKFLTPAAVQAYYTESNDK